MEVEKTFYLIGGPNGSGKTTLIKRIVQDGIEILDMDSIAASKNVSNITAARQLLNEDLPRVLSSGHSFVLESTLSGTYDTRIIKMAHDLKYRVVFVFAFLESVKQNIDRVALRVRQGGHDVDTYTICRRYEKSLHNFHKIVPLVDKWILFYNGEDTGPCEVANGTGQTINVKNQKYCTLFRENCFDASISRLVHFMEIGASETRLAAEGFGPNVSFVMLEKLLGETQR